MHEDRVAQIHSHLTRRLPDCRITTHFDGDREAQRFKIRHGRVATHVLLVEEGAIDAHSHDDLMRLLDRAVERMRQTSTDVEVLVTRHGIRGD
jgi:hypothetical protein